MKKFWSFLLLVVSMAICIPVMAGSSPVAHVVALAVVLLAMLLPGRRAKWYEHTANGVNITIGNGNLGSALQTNDGVVGMVLTGSTGDTYTLGTPIMITSYAEALAVLTVTNNAFALRQISDFYSVPGTNGAELYLMLVADTLTVQNMCDLTNSNGAIKLLNFAAGAIKVLGCMSDDTIVTVASITAGINPACYLAIVKMQALASQFQAAQMPFRGIIGGTSYNGTVGSLTAINSGTTNNRVQMLLGDIEPSSGYSGGKAACLGFELGLLATLPVQRKISRVKNGPLSGVTEAYVGTHTVEAAGSDIATIAGKGFVTIQTKPQSSGYFFTGDPMCTATTDDFASMVNGRVIDKAQIIAYQVFMVDEDDEVPVAPDGTIDPSYAASLQNSINKAYKTNLIANNNASAATSLVALGQNVVGTGDVAVTLSIQPESYATTINITLGLSATA